VSLIHPEECKRERERERVFACLFVCARVCVCVCFKGPKYIAADARERGGLCAWDVCVCVCGCVCVCVYVCVCVAADARACVQTYKFIYTKFSYTI